MATIPVLRSSATGCADMRLGILMFRCVGAQRQLGLAGVWMPRASWAWHPGLAGVWVPSRQLGLASRLGRCMDATAGAGEQPGRPQSQRGDAARDHRTSNLADLI